MKTLLYVLLFYFISFNTLIAQTRQTIRIQPGENAREKLWNELYQYPLFIQGKAIAKDGTASGGLMNYNRLTGRMHFIDGKGDTLILEGETALQYISMGRDTFYVQNGYLQKLKEHKHVTFAVQQKLSYVDAHKVGAMGIPSKTANIESKAVYENDKRFSLAIHEELVFSKQQFYFFRKENITFLPLTKKNILKAFPQERQKIEAYISANSVQLDDEKDIHDLMAFLGAM